MPNNFYQLLDYRLRFRHTFQDNKIYNKMGTTETVYWNDASKNEDVVLKSELHKEVITILGYKCDELVLTCKSGTQKY